MTFSEAESLAVRVLGSIHPRHAPKWELRVGSQYIGVPRQEIVSTIANAIEFLEPRMVDRLSEAEVDAAYRGLVALLAKLKERAS